MAASGSGVLSVLPDGETHAGVRCHEVAFERFHSQQTADVIQHSSDMEVQVSVHPTTNSTGIYDDHRHPFLSSTCATFHGLTDADRTAMGKQVTAVAAPDATLYLLVWPRRRRPLIKGVNRDEVEAAFPGWEITDMVPSFFKPPRVLQWILRPDEHWYRLRRAA